VSAPARRGVLLVVLCATIALIEASSAASAATPMPTERNCLLAWNARSNEASWHRLVSSGRWKGALLVDAVVGTDTIPPSSTAHVGRQACALLVRDGGRALQVIGRWNDGRVAKWTFSRVFRLQVHVVRSNVRILRDGRVTKLYRR
jgi:hypothetical protein